MSTHAENARSPRWTGQQDAIGFKLWREGERTEVIGARLGRSKRGVIGHARSMGWGPHPVGVGRRRKVHG